MTMKARLAEAMFKAMEGSPCHISKDPDLSSVTIDGSYDLYMVVDALLTELEKPTRDVFNTAWARQVTSGHYSRNADELLGFHKAVIKAIREGK